MIKKFKTPASELVQLIQPMGSCVASDKITVDGENVQYMYRENPFFDTDCGWRFFSSSESQEYIDNPHNLMIYDVNTIANCDKAIIPYLHLEIGIELQRIKDSETFIVLNGSQN